MITLRCSENGRLIQTQTIYFSFLLLFLSYTIPPHSRWALQVLNSPLFSFCCRFTLLQTLSILNQFHKVWNSLTGTSLPPEGVSSLGLSCCSEAPQGHSIVIGILWSICIWALVPQSYSPAPTPPQLTLLYTRWVIHVINCDFVFTLFYLTLWDRGLL